MAVWKLNVFGTFWIILCTAWTLFLSYVHFLNLKVKFSELYKDFFNLMNNYFEGTAEHPGGYFPRKPRTQELTCVQNPRPIP